MKLNLFFKLIIVILTGLFLSLNAELIKISKLKKEKEKKFTLKRDIFSPFKTIPKKIQEPIKIKKIEPPPLAPKKADIKKSVEDEIRQSVLYEGFVIKNTINNSFSRPSSRPRWVYVLKSDAEKKIDRAIIGNDNIRALLTVNEEYFVVSAGDVILDKIMIIKIEEKKITLEVDSFSFEIFLKEEPDD